MKQGRGCLGTVILIVVMLLLFIGWSHTTFGMRLNRTYDIEVEAIPIPADEASIKRGRRLATIGRCTDCHGLTLRGRIMSEDPIMGRLAAPNLTPGKGGVGGEYTDEDWIRAIRHGIGRDGRTLLVTPAQFYNTLSDEDLGDLIAYLKQLKPYDNEVPQNPSLGPLGRTVVTLLNPSDWLPAEKIDHDAPRPLPVEPGPTAAYGGYLWNVSTCGVCHDRKALRATLETFKYDQKAFRLVMRTGLGPRGIFSSTIMPWPFSSHLSDEELEALWIYLQSEEPDDTTAPAIFSPTP